MDNLLALVVATAVLVLIPGPNVALIVAGSLQYGRRFGLATVAGTTLGVALQLLLVVLGYTSLVASVAGALVWIKWAGVVALLILGIRALRAIGQPIAMPALPLRVGFRRGLLLAVVNPKTLLFSAAFLPQFVSNAALLGAQLPLFAMSYLAVLAAGDCGWVLAASGARRLLARAGHWPQRLSGALLLGASGALALNNSAD